MSELDEELKKLDEELKEQDLQIQQVNEARDQYNKTGDIDSYIAFWEKIWDEGGLKFNGATLTFTLPDLYIKQGRYDDALRILKKITNPVYQDRVNSYIDKISSKIGQ